jgi:hypothetical protein
MGLERHLRMHKIVDTINLPLPKGQIQAQLRHEVHLNSIQCSSMI